MMDEDDDRLQDEWSDRMISLKEGWLNQEDDDAE